MKFLYILSLLVLLCSCKKQEATQTDNETEQTLNRSITESDVSKIKYTEFVLSPEAQKAIENWAEYSQLQEQIGYVKKGDLSYFNDNKKAIETLLKGLNKNIPDHLNDNAILARLKAIETITYKLEGLVQLSTSTKPELIDGIKELLIAVSNLDLQLNKLMEFKRNDSIQKP
ncbi:hypothetical protein [Aestuariivivens insulae]|uniref:hypothetical protein n=1 Tax=Aestuariivivens insulae TaxID=1621988 RepID=UPI001F5A0F76|nr:hypothetical protein [Aestuariivivens insulae]